MLEIIDGTEREPDTGRIRQRTSAATFRPGDVIPAGRLAPALERRLAAGDPRVESIVIPGYDQPNES
ncbi:hypothetical protein LRS13_13505 [Svornostia abyssi]|uniref:Uncharacterized protein n=1 Tax=Svornostia abyssi TaxID=2898438 RepID=A0ABY5PAN4_9ACTN|nr:hypothetical protein LRS13_13505 [Parviterribacteraceae bacterium J379]